jgi:hypothetical protein
MKRSIILLVLLIPLFASHAFTLDVPALRGVIRNNNNLRREGIHLE